MRQHLLNLPQRGLTLIELMVTLSIAVILLTIGVPSFVDFMNASKATAYANDLLADLNYARSEAITRGVRVTVCHSNDAATCSGNWSNGWIVFANTNAAGTQNVVDNGDEILRVHTAVEAASGWVLNANNNFANFVAFLPDGRSNTVGTFTICKNGVMNMERGKAILVNRTGRARIATDTDVPGNGTPDRDDNSEIACIPADE